MFMKTFKVHRPCFTWIRYMCNYLVLKRENPHTLAHTHTHTHTYKYIHIYIYIYIYFSIYIFFFLEVECSPMVRETSVQSWVASYQTLKKWYFILPYLILSNIRYVSKVKLSNSGEGVAPSPIPWCSSH